MQQYIFAGNTLIFGLVGCFLLYKNLILPGLICFIASISYAYILASTYIAFTQNDVYRARYFDWIITTPIILYLILCETDLELGIVYALMASSIIMIILGYFATKSRKHAILLFCLSCLFLAPIIYFLSLNYKNLLAIFTLIIWLIYPIVWLLTYNRTIDNETNNQVIAILDLVAKVGFCILYYITL